MLIGVRIVFIHSLYKVNHINPLKQGEIGDFGETVSEVVIFKIDCFALRARNDTRISTSES